MVLSYSASHLHMRLVIAKSNTTCAYSQGLQVINYIAPSHMPIQWIASDDCQIQLHMHLFPVDCVWLITLVPNQPHICVNGSGSFRTFQSTLPSFPEGRLRRIGFARNYYLPSINERLGWPAHLFNLFRTHDGNDVKLSKDISHGTIRAPSTHCPEFLQTHWGGSLVTSVPDSNTHVPLLWLSFELS